MNYIIDQNGNIIGDIENEKSENKLRCRNKPINKEIVFDNEYYVDKIFNKRTDKKGKTEFLIKWRNYDLTDCSWENEEDVFCSGLIKDFYKNINLVKEHNAISCMESTNISMPEESSKPNLFFNLQALKNILRGRDLLKQFCDYTNTRLKLVKATERLKMLETCKIAKLIPDFLKFRIPENGKFSNSAVFEFQIKLLKKEIFVCKENISKLNSTIIERRRALTNKIHCDENNSHLLKHIVHHSNILIEKERDKIRQRLNGKLDKWSYRQDTPLCKVNGTIKFLGEITRPPDYVIETLKLGPRNPILETFDDKEVLSEMDIFLEYCETKVCENEVINDINMLTHSYCKQASKQKIPRNLKLTNQYLKEQNLKAVPFDKGIGFCVMGQDEYNKKLKDITKLEQFEPHVDTRKNARNPTIKEEDRISNELLNLQKSGNISEELYKALKPIGSRPAQLYGLAKVRKTNIPLRPIVSVPGTSYHKISLDRCLCQGLIVFEN